MYCVLGLIANVSKYLILLSENVEVLYDLLIRVAHEMWYSSIALNMAKSLYIYICVQLVVFRDVLLVRVLLLYKL